MSVAGAAMQLQDMTTVEVEAALATCRTVIIPFGAVEAHGGHLPLATDVLTAADAARRAAELVDVFVAPVVPYGVCRSAAEHPGTMSISAATLRGLVFDLLESLHGTGFRNFILYSGHASTQQTAAMEEGTERMMRVRTDANVAIVLEYDVIRTAGRDLYETKTDLHAGEIETSRILAIRPDLVGRDKLPAASYREPTRPLLVRSPRRHWEGSTDGAPRLASVEKGEALSALLAKELAALVRRIESFEPH